jgi:hypothetical protein
LEWRREDAVVEYFKVLFHYQPGSTEEYHESTSVSIGDIKAKTGTKDLHNTKLKLAPICRGIPTE